MKPRGKTALFVIFQFYFVFVNCYELVSYDTPQEAMRAATETENSDTSSKNVHVVENDEEFDQADDNLANKASVSCLKNNMVIAIPKYVLRGADREHIRALNVSCTASENLTHFFLDVPLTSCGTKRRHTISSVVYTNEALPVPPMLKDVVSHVPDFQIPFHCYYDNNGVVTSVGLKPFSKKVIFSKKGFGRFVIKLTLFPDMRFVGPYTQSDFPVMKKLRERIYFEASVDTDDHRLTILARDCYATPSSNRNSNPKYWIIQKGCKVDETLIYHPSNHLSERFSVESFSFIGDHPFVFVHCHVRICNASDPNSKCVRICEDVERRKRDVRYAAELGNDVYPLAQGPLSLLKEEVDVKGKSSSIESAGPNIPVIAMLVGVLALCITGAAYMAIGNKRKTVKHYSTLVQEIQN